MLFTLILTWRHTWSPWYASDQRFLAPLQQGLPRQHLPAKTPNYQVITGNLDGESDQTELDAVEDPLDGEAGQEDHTWEEDEAEVEAAWLDPCPAHVTHPPARVWGVWWQMLVTAHISRPGLQALILRCRGRSHSGSAADWRQIQGSETQSSGHGGKLLVIMMRIKEFIHSLSSSIISRYLSLSLTLTVSFAI